MELDRKKIGLIIIYISAYLLVFSIIIFFIWFKPQKKEYGIKYTEYTDETSSEKSINIYSKEIARYLALNNYRQIYSILQGDFKIMKGINENNIKSYLTKYGYFSNTIETISYSTYEEDGIKNYILKLNIDNKEKTIVINEISPYNYTISLGEELYNLKYDTNTYYSENIEFVFTRISYSTEHIEFEVKIKNNNSSDVTFDFNNVRNFCIITEDNQEIYINSNISSPVDAPLKKDSYIIKNMYFNVPIESKIKYIKFSNVKIGEENNVIKIYI